MHRLQLQLSDQRSLSLSIAFRSAVAESVETVISAFRVSIFVCLLPSSLPPSARSRPRIILVKDATHCGPTSPPTGAGGNALGRQRHVTGRRDLREVVDMAFDERCVVLSSAEIYPVPSTDSDEMQHLSRRPMLHLPHIRPRYASSVTRSLTTWRADRRSFVYRPGCIRSRTRNRLQAVDDERRKIWRRCQSTRIRA